MSFNESYPLEVLSSSSNTSAENEKSCSFCDKVFAQVINRKRHEQDHHASASISSRMSVHGDFDTADPSLLSPHSPITSEPVPDSNENWKTPELRKMLPEEMKPS